MLSNTSAVTCYSRDKTSAADSPYPENNGIQLVACNPGNVNSTCCYAKETCAPDLLCHGDDGSVARQYCTDPTWTTDQCSKLCPSDDVAGTVLTECPDGSYCCGVDNFKCCGRGAGIKINRSNGQLLPKSQTTRSPIPSATATRPSGSRSSAADNVSSLTTAPPTDNVSSLTTAPPSNTAANPTTSPLTPSSSRSSNNGGPLTAGAKAGIAIGCIAAAALVAALLLLLLRERRKRKSLLLQKDETAGAGHNGQAKGHGDGQGGIFQQQVPVPEMSARQIQELSAHGRQEMNAR